MIKEFIEKFDKNRYKLINKFKEKHPISYDEIVSDLIEVISDGESYGYPCKDKINSICEGDYQGKIVYVICEGGACPYNYWYTTVDYGSCSVCDTLQSIQYDDGNYSDPPNEQQVKDYMTLALHILQKLKPI